MLKVYTYQLQFTVHFDDGRYLTENRQVRANNSEEINQAFINILKNEYPDHTVSNLKIYQATDS